MSDAAANPDHAAAARRAFFRAADETARAGGYFHSQLIATRARADFTGIDLMTLMREWMKSREYPLERLTWSRIGAIGMWIGSFFLPVLSFVFQEMAGRGRNPSPVIMTLAGLGSVGLIAGGVMLWMRGNRTRREITERANTFCPECRSAVDPATARCPCGYLESRLPAPSGVSAPPAPGILVVPPPLPATIAASPVVTSPPAKRELVWEIETEGEPLRLTGIDAIRTAVLEGRVTAETKARVFPAAADAPPPAWSNVRAQAFFTFGLHVLYAPVWAHTMRGLRIGALAGMTVWLLNAIYALFVVAGNPVAGMIVVLCIWGVSNLLLPPRIVFFSSRIFWGAVSLTLIVSHLNFGSQIWGKGIAVGIGAFFGAITAGALVGGLGGMAVGTLAGYVRRRKLPRAPDAVTEGGRPLLTGVLIPLVVVAGVIAIYVRWILPWIARIIADRQ